MLSVETEEDMGALDEIISARHDPLMRSGAISTEER